MATGKCEKAGFRIEDLVGEREKEKGKSVKAGFRIQDLGFNKFVNYFRTIHSG